MANNDPGKGALFPNSYHAEGDKKPVMTGHLFAHRDLRVGERIELAAWHHKTGWGMSIKAQDVRVPSAGTPPQTPSGRVAVDGKQYADKRGLDDEIPF
jgi:hypothetical protein